MEKLYTIFLRSLNKGGNRRHRWILASYFLAAGLLVFLGSSIQPMERVAQALGIALARTQAAPPTEPHGQTVALVPTSSMGPRVHLLVTGEPEAGQVLTFFLHPFQEENRYHIYFGDGTKQVAMARNRHLYRDAGHYRLRVVVMNQLDTINNQTFSLHIRPSAALSTTRPQTNSHARPAGIGIMPREGVPASEEAVRIVDHGSWEEEAASEVSAPLMFAEEMPSFPGGVQALQRFLNRAVTYPHAAKEQSVEGKVVVQFVVQPDGQLADIQFVQELGYGCEEAVLHALAQMPTWIPGRHEGREVAVYYVLPVEFKLM